MGGNWTPDDIYHFIANPKGMIPGTAMTFAGMPRPSERADIIAFLNTKSDSPAQLPKAAEAAPAAQYRRRSCSPRAFAMSATAAAGSAPPGADASTRM